MGSPTRVLLSDYAAEIIEGLAKRHHLTSPEVIDLLCRHELERLKRVLGQRRRQGRSPAPEPAPANVARKPVYLDVPPPEDDGPLFAQGEKAPISSLPEAPPAPPDPARPVVRTPDDPDAPEWVRTVADDLGSGVSEDDIPPARMNAFRLWLRGDDVLDAEEP